MNEHPSAWLTSIEGLPEVHARLQRVVILCQPALKVIKSQDDKQTFFYCDPPYPHETRQVNDHYEYEMTLADHEELLAVLAGVKGKFMLSSYVNPLYEKFAKRHGWRRVDFDAVNHMSAKKTKPSTGECVYLNYKPPRSDASLPRK
jgi:DNA adenine methylase